MARSYARQRTNTQPVPDTHLQGRRLVIARVTWASLVILTLGLFTAMLPAYFMKIQMVCASPVCALGQPSLEAIQALQIHGLSVANYAEVAIVLTLLVTLTCVVVAAFILWHRSDDWMALFVALALVMEGTTFVTYSLEWSPSTWHAPAFILSTLSWSVIFLLSFLFPDGRFVPRWTRWLVIGWIGLNMVAIAFPNFFAFTLFSNLIWLLLCACCMFAQIYRYRQVSSPVQRQQTKWIVYGTSLGIAMVIALEIPILSIPSFGPGSLYSLVSWYGFMLALVPFPLSIGFAVQRSRLWDIDNVINRTLVYGLLTALLVLAYFGGVALLQNLFRTFTGQGSPFAMVVSTLAIATLFHPLRKYIQTFIDMYCYRRRYHVSQILSKFDARMRSLLYSPGGGSLEALADLVRESIGETLQPRSISLWLYEPELQKEADKSVQATSLRQDESRPVPVARNDPLMASFLSAPGVVEIELLHLNSSALQSLKDAGIHLSVPFISQGELVGLLNLGPRRSEQGYSSDDRELLSRLAIQAAPAIRVAQLVRRQQAQAREQERLEQELRVARLIQHAFLPKDLPALPGWQVAAYYQPARAVGGDFYDFIPFEDGRLGLVIGDVTDKGIPAALLMTTTRSILRSVAQTEMSPGKVLAQTNNLLCLDMPPKMFVTCLYAILDPASGLLRYANAGHDQPYQQHGDCVSELWARGMPLGLMPDMTYEEKETMLERGDRVLFYSDGLVEAHNPEHDMFSFPRLVKLLEEQREDPDLIELLLRQLGEFTGPDWEQEDDVTLVTLQRSPGYGRSEVATRSLITAEETIGNEALAVARNAPGNV